MKKYLLITLTLITGYGYSQNIDVLNKISDLQCQGDTFYNDGLFPSLRSLGKEKNLREDNNIFFTALIVYTLQSIRDSVTLNEKILIDSIVSNSKKNYPNYQNRNGDITYNFWQVHPELPAPNSKFLSRKEKVRLPDDLDDTSIIFLTRETSDSLNEVLKQKMNMHTNSAKKGIRSTFKRYRYSKAYCTWFADKMKQDFDICVMANTLLFVFQKGLVLNKADTQTLELIEQMIKNNDHLTYPHIISPWYQNSSIILYHLSRLVSIANNETLNGIRGKIIQDLYKQLQLSTNSMERIILLSSLHRLNESVTSDMDFKKASKDMETFFWFQANPFAASSMFTRKNHRQK